MIEYIQSLQDTDVPKSECKRCEHGEYEYDEHCSGYSCGTDNEEDCPYMERFEIDVDKLTKVKVEDAFIIDHPEYQDAFISSAEYFGDQLTEIQLEWVNNNHPEIITKYAPKFSR